MAGQPASQPAHGRSIREASARWVTRARQNAQTYARTMRPRVPTTLPNMKTGITTNFKRCSFPLFILPPVFIFILFQILEYANQKIQEITEGVKLNDLDQFLA